MDRAHWRALAEERVLDADSLLKSGRWAGAYHLAGYAVESGLKACVLAHMENGNAGVIFREKRFSEHCWTHNLKDLVGYAGLRSVLELDRSLNRQLDINWADALQWKETSRYELTREYNARNLVNAITDATNGVLPWIRIRW